MALLTIFLALMKLCSATLTEPTTAALERQADLGNPKIDQLQPRADGPKRGQGAFNVGRWWFDVLVHRHTP
jgi:hypothetical protein